MMMATPILEKPEIFNDEEYQFLTRIAKQHPAIGQKLDRYLNLPPSIRYSLAKVELMEVERAGWVRRGISYAETVYDHLNGMADLIDKQFARWISGLAPEERTVALRMSRRMMGMAKVHDIPEAIASDFTPHDEAQGKISASDKHRLELLCARIIFEDRPELMELYQEFSDQRTDASQLTHDFDKIHAVMGAVYYQAKYPEKTDLWDEFYPYAKSKLKTVAGHNVLEEIAKTRETITELLRMPPQQSARAR